MPLGWKFSEPETDIKETVPDAELVGSLTYLSQSTRHDIAHVVGVLRRYMSAPKLEHWELPKRALRYLRGTYNFGLRYCADSKLVACTDSDFAGDFRAAKSTTGCVFERHGVAIFWASKLQSVVATLTCEAEYIAAALGQKRHVGCVQI
jgi:hypothetical protein